MIKPGEQSHVAFRRPESDVAVRRTQPGEAADPRPGNAAAVFFSSWLRAPLKVASIVPSSRQLGAAIARQIDPKEPGWVVELGAGTGPITEQLLARGIPPERLFVLERDPVLVRFLRERYPEPVVIEGDAFTLPELLARHGVDRVHSVVCGIPLLSMPKADAGKLVSACRDVIGPDGQFLQYTYSLFSPLPYRDFALTVRRVKRVLANIPPASVWTYERASTRN
jgi:phosphatidylethanolamine/phosphatidyl-N-methylethanolamine N-methyltransferase